MIVRAALDPRLGVRQPRSRRRAHYSMYGLVGPKEQLMMEITYTKL